MLRIAVIFPTVAVERDGIVGIPQENAIDDHVGGAHQVDTVAPAFAAKGLQIPDGEILRLPSENRVVSRIDDDDAINLDVLRKRDLDAFLALVQHTSPDDADILRLVTK